MGAGLQAGKEKADQATLVSRLRANGSTQELDRLRVSHMTKNWWTWPDDFYRAGLTGEQVITLLGMDLTMTVELKSGETFTFSTASGNKVRFTPEDFQTIVDEMKREFLSA
jgi:hypothetical protein